jgi:LuxR family maltose regulon positive regulatory protein
MQQYSLLQTKLYIPPIRPELISRPRLIERLNAGLPTRGGLSRTQDAFPRALTLISAPAGFGKTTLVSEWVQAMSGATPPIAVAWLSLDEEDNDPARFLAYLIAALRTIEASIGKGVLSALQSPQPPPADVVLTSLINEIAAFPNSVILVLDDHHTIESSPVDDALAFLLERLPLQMHLVIATREDPHLPLARLRARGQLTEVRASDLRFTPSEAARFLNQAMGLNLSAKEIAALEARTEGWIAGLQLAAISIQGRNDTPSLIRSFTGSHRFVLDYLVEEVLEQQSESIQAFLLQTAILDQLTGSLCDAVRFGHAETPGSSSGTSVFQGAAEAPTGQDTGQAILEKLDHANLFIVPLDNERCWYRYHQLFADLLRQRLGQTRHEQVPVLHQRASEWYKQHGFFDEAIEHALRGEDFEIAARVIEEHVDTAWERGEHTKLRRWLAALPVDTVFSRPHLGIFHAWMLYTSGQQDAAEQSLQAVEQTLEPGNERAAESTPRERWQQQTGHDEMKLRGRAAVIRALMATYRSDAPGIILYARHALECLPEQDLAWRGAAAIALGDAHVFRGEYREAYQARAEALDASEAAGNAHLSMNVSLKQASNLRARGRLRQVVEICQQQWQIAEERGLSQTAVVGWLLAIWGEVLAETNELDEALDLVRKGVELAEKVGYVAVLGWSYLYLTRVLYSRGDLDGAEEAIEKMATMTRRSDLPPWFASLMAAWQARIWLAQDRLETASQWVGELGLDVDGELSFLREIEYVALARILIAQGRLQQASRLLQRLNKPAEAGGRTTSLIEILSLQALAFRAGVDTAGAMTALERALTLAEPGGFIRIFVDEGPPMARLLYEALSRGIAPDYVRRLLAAFPNVELEQPESTKPQVSEAELIEPLSERELEVLQLIAEGLTNPEIASRLFVSLNTVKAHARNIYGKLGVHNRTQAVAKAKALGVLTSN